MEMLAAQCKTRYKIWLGENASESEKHAARELAMYLKRITGANFPVVAYGDVPQRAILVGDSAHLAALGIDLEKENLGEEGFILRTVGPNLVIAGGRLRGTLYGVYTFLEEILGCRWYTETVERVPHSPDLPLPDLNVRTVPQLEYRESFYVNVSQGGDWSARNKNNGNSMNLYPHQGGKVVYYPFVHTFESILSAEEHFDAHPEYFSLVDGRRLKEKTQLCLTNPDVVRLTIETVRTWIREHPEATILSISQNDWYNPCQCPACKEIDDREGSHAGSLIHFMNQIAEVIGKESPHIILDTLAYQYTRTPPRHIRPLPNICVRLCSIECCFAHPLDQCDHISSFADRIRGDSFQRDLEGWSTQCDRLYVWDYIVNFHHYCMPFANFDVLGPNIRYFIRNHVKGIFEEGATNAWGGAEFAELRAWVTAKLLWNPDQETQPLVEDFISGYYGAAAPAVQAYFDLIHEKKRAKPEAHFGIYDPPRACFLTQDVIEASNALFDAAEIAAESPEVLERVRIARLPMRYWELLVMPLETPGRQEAIAAFRESLESRSIDQITEGRSLDWSFDALNAGLTYRFPQP